MIPDEQLIALWEDVRNASDWTDERIVANVRESLDEHGLVILPRDRWERVRQAAFMAQSYGAQYNPDMRAAFVTLQPGDLDEDA